MAKKAKKTDFSFGKFFNSGTETVHMYGRLYNLPRVAEKQRGMLVWSGSKGTYVKRIHGELKLK